jgi:hypothetical protein
MPFPGAAADMGAAFDIRFRNGIVEDPDTWDPAVFVRPDGTLADHPITWGRIPAAEVHRVGTFDGAAFQADAPFEPLLRLGPSFVSYESEVAWDIDDATPMIAVGGWLQGAVGRIGEGRLVLFADATMFSAQVAASGSKLGMNTPDGEQNLQLLLNVLHWMTGKLDGST